MGEGWLYHLSGQPLQQPAIALGAHWSGVVEWSEDAVRVRAGTLWGELIKRLWAARQHLTDGCAYERPPETLRYGMKSQRYC